MARSISLQRVYRRGFSLIELLVAISIIAMLATLSSVAFVQVKTAAARMRVQIEIDQLRQAMDGYKEKTRDYPPAFSEAAVEGTAILKQRFIQHLTHAFPSFNPPGGTIDDQYKNIWTAVNTKYSVRQPNGSGVRALNLDDLVLNQNGNSAAEALVFWLSGFPMVIDTDSSGGQQTIGTQKTFGFHNNTYNPFQLDEAFPSSTSTIRRREIMLSKRTARLFAFDESRLVDLDQDGWLEYSLPGEDDANNQFKVHPYVYFDYRSYARPGAGAYSSSGNPTNAPGYRPYVRPDLGGTDQLYDVAVPYASRIDRGSQINFQNGTSIYWMNDRSFQIVCSGLDSNYGSTNAVFKLLPNEQSNTNYIQGGYLSAPDGQLLPFTKEDEDNQVNFAAGTVADIRLKN